jgi:hypothetical protein
MNREAFLIIVTLMVGCQTAMNKGEGIGSWECARGARVSCVDVQSNGTYTQTITAAGRKELSTSSTWTWESKPDEGMGILFKGFQHLNDRGEASDKPAGLWLVVPERRVPFGTPRLVVSDDEGIYYSKRSTPCEVPAK